MSTVYRGLGSQIARAKFMGPLLAAIADDVEATMLFVASEHVDTGDYAHSIEVTIDRSSPSGQDRYVGPTDPEATVIEYGYVDDRGRVHDGQHIVEKTAALIPGV